MQESTVLLPVDDALDWLDRFDRGEGVVSREIGGIGPSHEQTIQLIAAEALRELSHYRDSERLPPLETVPECEAIRRLIDILQPTLTQVEYALTWGRVMRLRGPSTLKDDDTIEARKIILTKFYPSFS